MKKVFYINTCSTCKKILDELDLSHFELIDIKNNPLTQNDLKDLVSLSQSYEALFSKRAQLYKKLNLKEQQLTEEDYKKYLLEHYTFLKRPVLIDGNFISIGSSPKTKKLLLEKYGSK